MADIPSSPQWTGEAIEGNDYIRLHVAKAPGHTRKEMSDNFGGML